MWSSTAVDICTFPPRPLPSTRSCQQPWELTLSPAYSCQMHVRWSSTVALLVLPGEGCVRHPHLSLFDWLSMQFSYFLSFNLFIRVLLYSGHLLYVLCKYHLACGLFSTLLYRNFLFYAAKFIRHFLYGMFFLYLS